MTHLRSRFCGGVPRRRSEDAGQRVVEVDQKSFGLGRGVLKGFEEVESDVPLVTTSNLLPAAFWGVTESAEGLLEVLLTAEGYLN
ncbi:hypothetical protein AB1N83_005599 [Pleurotus pulmonarius]